MEKKCELETILGREGIVDGDGEFTGEFAIIAMCNGAMGYDCEWKHVLVQQTAFGADWFISSDGMNLLHAAHQAGVPVTLENGSAYIV